MPQLQTDGLAQQPWLRDFLESLGFEPNGSDSFSNGRSTVRIDGTTLHAIPGNGTNVWRSELREARPDTIRQLLTIVLAGPSFLSQAELDRRATQRVAALQALDQVADTIRESPESEGGRHLRRFLWSLFNQHHVVNLRNLKDGLDPHHQRAVSELFSGWIDGLVSDDALRRALVHSGEMDRWDSLRLSAPEHRRLTDAMDSVADLLRSMAPSSLSVKGARAEELLREALKLLQSVGEKSFLNPGRATLCGRRRRIAESPE